MRARPVLLTRRATASERGRWNEYVRSQERCERWWLPCRRRCNLAGWFAPACVRVAKGTLTFGRKTFDATVSSVSAVGGNSVDHEGI